VAALAEGVIVFDREFNVLARNAAMGQMFQSTGGGSIIDTGWAIADENGRVLTPDEYPGVRTLMDGIARHDIVLRVFQTGFPTRWISVNCEPIVPDEGGPPTAVVCSLTDITKRKQVEIEREQAIRELEAKNAELERFTYSVSHDLKGPLITIRAYLGLLERDLADGASERVREDLGFIRAATEKMSALLSGLLELSRATSGSGERMPCSLSEIADEAIASLRGSIQSSQAQVARLHELPVVFGERVRLIEVFQNLIDNAIKYTLPHARPHIEIGRRNEGEVVLFVRDNGPGIAPRYHEKVFGLFERLDTSLEGTGVGLALVRKVVETHGGRIWIESDGVQGGSVFAFTLPP
jgi:signal transduction histidine kinase